MTTLDPAALRALARELLTAQRVATAAAYAVVKALAEAGGPIEAPEPEPPHDPTLDLDPEMGARYDDATAHLLRRMVDEYSRRAELAGIRHWTAPDGAEKEMLLASCVAEIQVESLRSSVTPYVVRGRDPVAGLLVRSEPSPGATPLNVACCESHKAAAIDLHNRLVAAGLRPNCLPIDPAAPPDPPPAEGSG